MTSLKFIEPDAFIKADCLCTMERMPSKSADLIYLDPPWNIGSKFYDSSVSVEDEYDEFIFSVLQQAHRVLRDHGNLLIYSNPILNINFHRLAQPVFGQENFRGEIVITIKNRQSIFRKGEQSHETVIHYSISDKYVYNKAVTNEFGTIWTDINLYNSLSPIAGAQTLSFTDRLVRIFSNAEQLILDPFTGTAVLGKSALKNNRKWIGIDKYDDAINIARETLQGYQVQFIPERNVKNYPVIWDRYSPFHEPNSSKLKSLIMSGENERTEFKEAYAFNDFSKIKDSAITDKVMKEIAAFLNHDCSGTILLGVRDNGEIRGLQEDIEAISSKSATWDTLELAMTSKIRSIFGGIATDLVRISKLVVDEKIVGIIRVSPAQDPVFLNGIYYRRDGTQATPLSTEEFYKLQKSRNTL